MKKKIVGIFVCMLLIVTAVLPVMGTVNFHSKDLGSRSVQSEVMFSAYDTPEFTEFVNYEDSNDVILARSLIEYTNVFYEIPSGEWITFHPDGSYTGSTSFDSFQADVKLSQTTITYTVTKVSNCSISTDGGTTWTPIKVGDKLKTCNWYKRDQMTCSELWVTDANGNKLGMPHTDIIYIIVAHHVPNDPRFENVNGYKDYADFNYAAFDTTSDYCVASGNTLVKTGAQIGLQSDKAEAFIPQRYGEPDLCCDGRLSWDEVTPGSTVTGDFDVSNCGDDGSELNWEVKEWPNWGTWTFTPSSGTGLTPAMGWINVDVEVVAPDDPDTEFTGEVKVINSDDPSDFCIISVYLKTPVNQNNMNMNVFQLLQQLMQRLKMC